MDLQQGTKATEDKQRKKWLHSSSLYDAYWFIWWNKLPLSFLEKTSAYSKTSLQILEVTKRQSVQVWLPENVLQHILGQRCWVEHDKQALPRLAVRRRQLLQGRQAYVRLNPRRRRRSWETLRQNSEREASQQHAGRRQASWCHGEVSSPKAWAPGRSTDCSTPWTSSEWQQTAWPSDPQSCNTGDSHSLLIWKKNHPPHEL